MNEPFAETTNPTITPQSDVQQAADDLRSAAQGGTAAVKEAAADKAHKLRLVAEEKAAALKQATAEKAQQVKSAAADKAEQVKEIAGEQWQETRVKARELHATTEDYIRANPTKSVLTAVGIGFLIGILTRK